MEQLQAQIITRPARAEEAPIVLDLWQMSARWLNAKGIYQWRPEYFHLDQVMAFMADGSHVYLAYWNDAVVGTYTLTWSDPLIWQELDSTDAGYIHRFAVHREYEGKGLGGHLLHAAEEQIRQEGKSSVRLDCMADNARLNQYYQEMGYTYVRRLDLAEWSASLYEKK